MSPPSHLSPRSWSWSRILLSAGTQSYLNKVHLNHLGLHHFTSCFLGSALTREQRSAGFSFLKVCVRADVYFGHQVAPPTRNRSFSAVTLFKQTQEQQPLTCIFIASVKNVIKKVIFENGWSVQTTGVCSLRVPHNSEEPLQTLNLIASSVSELSFCSLLF